METIIQQIVVEMTEKLLKNINKASLDLNELSELLLEDCKETARKVIEACAKELNLRMRRDKEWRKGHLVLKEKNRPRRVFSAIGELELERDYYYDVGSRRYVTPLDGVLGIEKYERILSSVRAELVTQATECSYARSAELVTHGAVSRQTVRNQILKLQVPEKEPKQQKKPVKELHLYADEDHVHMQKPRKQKGKRSKMVPLVMVTEGIDKESNRHHTVNPMSFVDEEFNAKRLWKRVSGYIGKAYDAEALERIWIHADGGSWIKNGLEEYAQTVHIIDGFHFERELKRLANLYQGRNVRNRIHGAIEKDDQEQAEEILQSLEDKAENEKTIKRVQKFTSYLKSYWDEIRRRRTEDVPGSCTEGQVSHLLSKRFSRNPMGWSEAGLGKLSAARIYLKNGGKLTSQELKKTAGRQEKSYCDYAEQMLTEAIGDAVNWSIFNKKEIFTFDLASGTQQVLHSIGSYHSILN